MRKQLESMTRKQIEDWMRKNNMSIHGTYKMKKAELINAIIIGMEKEELFDPSKKYVFSKARYLERIEKQSGKRTLENVLQDKEIIEWLDKIDGQEVKPNKEVSNAVYVEDADIEWFKRNTCIEITEEAAEDLIEEHQEIKLEADIVVHCQTEKQANDFLKMCDISGIVWETGIEATTFNHWTLYRQDTCYHILNDKTLKFGNIDYFIDQNFEIIEFSELELKYNNTEKEAANNKILYDCWFRLCPLDDDLEESDIDIYNDMLGEIEKEYDDRLDNIEGFWYTISDLTEIDMDILETLFEKTEEKLNNSYISYDFDEVDEVA